MYIASTSRILAGLLDSNFNVLKPFLAKLFFWLSVILILAISFAPTTTSETIANLDKVVHFFMFLILSYLFWMAYRVPWPLISSILILGLFGLAVELVQYFIPSRIFSLYDFTANFAGIIAGALLYWLLTSLQTGMHSK